MAQQMQDGAPGSRCFVVCGKSITLEELQAAFQPFGLVTGVKVLREKGVAYVKYDRASSAALAIESLNGAVLNNGRGPKLKVLLAEAPSSRTFVPASTRNPIAIDTPELSSDPDNVPPRSRLFVVVPKQADPQEIKNDFIRFPDLEYCKTDLIMQKGVVFCKFSRSSSALHALETITDAGALAGYKVKVMLAEPKTKRIRDSPHELVYGMPGMQGRMDYNSYDALNKLNHMGGNPLGSSHMGGMALDHFNINGLGLGNLSSLANNMNMSGIANGMNDMNRLSSGNHMGGMGLGLSGNGMSDMSGRMNNNMAYPGSGMHVNHGSSISLSNDMQLGAQGLGLMNGLSNSMATSSSGSFSQPTDPSSRAGGSSEPVSPNNFVGMQYSKLRLFVVVHKGVSDDLLARLFRRFPGMEYCDLKKDKTTGKSKGYAYVNYSTAEIASEAVAQLNGVEFPPSSGHRIKVMFAEPLGTRATSSINMMSSTTVSNGTHVSQSMISRSPGVMSMPVSSASAGHTPLSHSSVSVLTPGLGLGAITPDTVASVSESLAGISLHHLSVSGLNNSMHGVVEGVDGLEPCHGVVSHIASPLAQGATVARELIYQ